MNRSAFSLLAAAVALCALPGISSAQYWSAEGPATPHYNGYRDPWEPGRVNGPVASGFGFTNAPIAPVYAVPSTWVSPPAVIASVPATPSALALEEEQEEAAHVASIQVRVPADAVLWFDGYRTKEAGTLRTFVSPPLETGKSFHYTVRARWTDAGGKVVERTKAVEVKAGQRSLADFLDQ